MTAKPKGTLIIIGGHEDKCGDESILNEVAKHARAKNSRLVIVTVATQKPEESAREYCSIFSELGVKQINHLDIRTRDEARDPERVRMIEDASVLFFTGGDQLRITSQIGDSLVFQKMHEIFQRGGTVVGTSAGAAAMPSTMLVRGAGDESFHISGLEMAPGLGLIDGVVIDSHFAERGRMGRLLGAVAQNPRNLGLGIDEDTAIVVEPDACFRVLGSGAVYVADGTRLSYSSLSEKQPEGIITIHDITLHVLGDDERFDLGARRPIAHSNAKKE